MVADGLSSQQLKLKFMYDVIKNVVNLVNFMYFFLTGEDTYIRSHLVYIMMFNDPNCLSNCLTLKVSKVTLFIV